MKGNKMYFLDKSAIWAFDDLWYVKDKNHENVSANWLIDQTIENFSSISGGISLTEHPYTKLALRKAKSTATYPWFHDFVRFWLSELIYNCSLLVYKIQYDAKFAETGNDQKSVVHAEKQQMTFLKLFR